MIKVMVFMGIGMDEMGKGMGEVDKGVVEMDKSMVGVIWRSWCKERERWFRNKKKS